jgi:hypothetical protein
MRTMGIALGIAAAAFAGAAAAQYYYPGERYVQRIDADQECWNPGAGHFERVRPGDVQNDLDFSRCRTVGGREYYYERAPRYERAPAPVAPSAGDECWNPRARHFEQVRPGERQDDLDFARCRPVEYGYRWR